MWPRWPKTSPGSRAATTTWVRSRDPRAVRWSPTTTRAGCTTSSPPNWSRERDAMPSARRDALWTAGSAVVSAASQLLQIAVLAHHVDAHLLGALAIVNVVNA